MEFSLICPNDGRVELGLEDVSAVVFRGSESVEVVFICPQCGSKIRAELRVPNLLGAAMELAQHVEEMDEGGAAEIRRRSSVVGDSAAQRTSEDELRARREQAGEPYCEYFRRQLERIECVEDLLAELE